MDRGGYTWASDAFEPFAGRQGPHKCTELPLFSLNLIGIRTAIRVEGSTEANP